MLTVVFKHTVISVEIHHESSSTAQIKKITAIFLCIRTNIEYHSILTYKLWQPVIYDHLNCSPVWRLYHWLTLWHYDIFYAKPLYIRYNYHQTKPRFSRLNWQHIISINGLYTWRLHTIQDYCTVTKVNVVSH